MPDFRRDMRVSPPRNARFRSVFALLPPERGSFTLGPVFTTP
ncbi:hypothetical protein HNR10_003976 [Nocardiopsis aegyptia]|uniref:Uncharacterized protein n=1 Tax=Nocardiopsis aegyptia TaxID=220378 RepID=A0A7Z0EPY6_9ACTN|nr:hypothetical protein [Nocardiopsis aegyptia]